jgi:signal transduction histidine kinase
LAVAAERARIARELHDVVAHNVSVMVALADGAQHTVGGDPDTARDAIGQVASVGREALTELRGLLGVLRDPAVAGASRAPQPGIDQLDELVGRVRAAGLQATVRVTGRPMAISAPAEMTIYRIAQEALTNALRHGDGTTSVEVRVRWRTDVVELEITDDGRTPRGVTGSPDGRGVAGMRERAGMHGAELSAGPRPGGGWLVATRIPLRADSAVRT